MSPDQIIIAAILLAVAFGDAILPGLAFDIRYWLHDRRVRAIR